MNVRSVSVFRCKAMRYHHNRRCTVDVSVLVDMVYLKKDQIRQQAVLSEYLHLGIEDRCSGS